MATGTSGKFTNGGVVDTVSAAGVIWHPWQVSIDVTPINANAARVNDTGDAPFVGNIFANFRNKLNYGHNGGPEEDEVKNPGTLSLNKNTDIFTFYNQRMEKQLLIVAAYVYSSCEDKNITSNSLRRFRIEIINIKARKIVYCTSFNKIGSVKDWL